MKKQIIPFLLFSIPFLGISQLYTPGAGVTDIDGNTYQSIIINGQEWMAENLKTSAYANGDPIPNVNFFPFYPTSCIVGFFMFITL